MNIGMERQVIDDWEYFSWHPDCPPRHIIQSKNIVTINLANQYTRLSTRLISEIAAIGGLSETFFVIAMSVALYFGGPFRDLDLGIHFNKMMRQINPNPKDAEYE